MPDPVHEGNLDDDAREQRIRTTTGRFGTPDCQCVPCFLLRRLDDARAELANLKAAACCAIVSAPVRSSPASRARDWSGSVDAGPGTLSRPVRVEVRPVIDATPRTPPLGHWWTTYAGLPLYDVTVSTACVVPGCGLGPGEHE